MAEILATACHTLWYTSRLLELNWDIRIIRTYREANACADALANYACEEGSTLIIFLIMSCSIKLFIFSRC
jgi:hypothetical protein